MSPKSVEERLAVVETKLDALAPVPAQVAKIASDMRAARFGGRILLGVGMSLCGLVAWLVSVLQKVKG